jgi:hypothetical protein
MVQAMAVVVSNKPKVHGRAVPISSLTGVGNWKKETPKSPRNNRFQKAIYCSNIEPSRPYISVRSSIISSIEAGSRYEPRACSWAIVLLTGSEGKKRGMKNTAVIPTKITRKY